MKRGFQGWRELLESRKCWRGGFWGGSDEREGRDEGGKWEVVGTFCGLLFV